ncbi:hypothetical protein [Nakamurella deserti]|uniref:hypothetical protein n=1 Tax=Nakamurella deserti TaxID=2164074 RepID=UPI000DBE3124|nr:hypothetical protein [Nakamurella deserti]
MNDRRDGIASPQQHRTKVEAAAGHLPSCWASALGLARRGRPPEEFEVSAERARALLKDDPAACRCVSENKGVRGRRKR